VFLKSPSTDTNLYESWDEHNFGNFLIQEYYTLNQTQNEKPYILFHQREVKVTNIFDCASSIDVFGKKIFISIKVAFFD